MLPSSEQRLWMYETMVKSRYYEARIGSAYMEGKRPMFNMANGPLPGEMHLSDGQEPCAVGVSVHLGPDDYMSAHHRAHAQAIAKGVNLKAMTAEIFGRKAGLSGGRGGHMHLFDPNVHFWTSGIIGQNMGPAVGAALGRKIRGEPGIAVAIIGEGAANQGAFHESLNLAAVWNLPFICIIEDNGWAVSVPKSRSTSVPRNHVRAVGYGIIGEHVEGNDPDNIFDVVGRAVERARSGQGPSLIEIETVRLQGHFMGDTEAYRPGEELSSKGDNDPISLYHAKLIGDGILTSDADKVIIARAKTEVDDAFTFAREAEEPRPEDALKHVFAA